MIHFIFSEKSKKYLFLKGDSIQDKDTFDKMKMVFNLVDPICYLPSYKGPKFTQDFLYEYTNKSGQKIYYCSIGMWQEIYKYCRDNNIAYDGLDAKMFKRDIKHSLDEFKEIVNSWGLKFPPRPYQYEAAYNVLCWNRSLSQIATRAGKTLISYLVFRYAMEYLNVKKILMIVPSIDLVKQAYNDFNEYAEFFKTECIWSQGKLVESSNLTVGTFQSLIKFIDRKSNKYNPAFFNNYDLIFVDEVHRATAEQVKTIISQPFMENVQISFGMTGTLPKEHTIERYTLAALMGPKIQNISPKELMDGGYISNVEIRQKMIHYLNEAKVNKAYIRAAEYRLSDYVLKDGEKVDVENPEFLFRHVKKLPAALTMYKQTYSQRQLFTEESNESIDADYIKLLGSLVQASEATNALSVEAMMVHLMDERTAYIKDILKVCDRNTLLLATHVEYIKYLYNEITESFPDKKVFMIVGGVNGKTRAKINKELKENDNCILIASYATCSTGLTFGNLCYGLFCESYKSNVINMQSIGRGLGLVDNKDKYILYDLVDCFKTSKIMLQGKEKQKIYKENCYNYTIEHVRLGKANT